MSQLDYGFMTFSMNLNSLIAFQEQYFGFSYCTKVIDIELPSIPLWEGEDPLIILSFKFAGFVYFRKFD